MNILRAAHLGLCFGVRDALALAHHEAAAGPVTVLGDLVHNETVLAGLRTAGVRLARTLDEVATPRVLITAHGTGDATRAAVRARGHSLGEATCPLVHHAHRALRELAAQGCHPVVIGQRGHVEVRGLTEDFPAADVVLTEADVDALPYRPSFGVIAQTTQPVARVRALVARLRARFPDAEVKFRDTVCQPTKQRQQAAEELARRCDVVLVIGGAHSNNTRELAATCARFCPRVHHVQTAADLRQEWFFPADTVGITAGTSTPDDAIAGIEATLRGFDRVGISDGHALPAPLLARHARHFTQNQRNRPEPDWVAPVTLPTEVIRPLVRSLAEFELGDGGGPAGLIAFDAARFRDASPAQRAMVDAWFAEERGHSRLLGEAVRRFGGRKIAGHWSFTAFCLVRRALGVRFELQVLTLTELVSTAYYRVLRRHADDAPLRAMCSLILRDEAGHLAFQRDRIAAGGRRGRAWRAQFWCLGHAAATVLWTSHARCLRALGGSGAEFFREVRRELRRFIVAVDRAARRERTFEPREAPLLSCSSR